MSKEILYPKQKEILNLIKGKDSNYLSLRDMAEKIGVNSPNTVLHHIHQLEKKGYLRRNPVNPQDYTVLKKPIEDIIYVNVYNMAPCGPNGLLSEDNLIDRIPLSTKAFGISDKVFLLKTKGDFMEPQIFENDLVLVVQQSDILSGQIGVVVHQSEVKITKIIKVKKNILLEFLNSKCRPEIVDKKEDFQILGLVKNIIHFIN